MKCKNCEKDVEFPVYRPLEEWITVEINPEKNFRKSVKRIKGYYPFCPFCFDVLVSLGSELRENSEV